MNVLVILLPLALALGGFGFLMFLWTVKERQYDDLDGDAWRAIRDDD